MCWSSDSENFSPIRYQIEAIQETDQEVDHHKDQGTYSYICCTQHAQCPCHNPSPLTFYLQYIRRSIVQRWNRSIQQLVTKHDIYCLVIWLLLDGQCNVKSSMNNGQGQWVVPSAWNLSHNPASSGFPTFYCIVSVNSWLLPKPLKLIKTLLDAYIGGIVMARLRYAPCNRGAHKCINVAHTCIIWHI